MLETLRAYISKFKQEHGSRIARVLMVGGVGFVIQTLIFESVGVYGHILTASTATLIGAECAILSNFFLNNRFSFPSDTHHHSLPMRLLRFHLVSSGSLATQWAFIFITEHLTHSILLLQFAYTLGIGIGFIINYAGYYLFVWHRE